MKLLLHACCGPCSLEPVRHLLEEGHDLTIAYMNSNIEPKEEYEHRLSTLLAWAKQEGIPVTEGPYCNSQWNEKIASAWNETAPRKIRCQECYRFRFEELARYAHEHHFEAIGTTLSVSPYQFTSLIKEDLERSAKLYPELTVLFSRLSKRLSRSDKTKP